MRLALVALLLVGVMGCDRSEDPMIGRGRIDEVEFSAAHQRRHCSRGCYTTHVPDYWYLRLSTPIGSRSFRLDHPPWNWQKPVADICVRYQRHNKHYDLLEIWAANEDCPPAPSPE